MTNVHKRHIKYFLDNSLKKYYKTNEVFETAIISKEFDIHLEGLSNEQIIDYLIYSIYIPDEYKHDSSEETIFTKLIEVLVSHLFNRIGLHSEYITTKSGREDVAIYFKENKEEVVVSDVKTFRLGRSQHAPNVKDFVKPSDFESEWARHHTSCFGGLIVFPRTHEWTKGSQVYTYCSNPEFPILMLSFTHLALLLKYKSNYNKYELKQLWDYNLYFTKIKDKDKNNYWKSVDSKLKEILKMSLEDYNSELEKYETLVKDSITLIVEEYLQEIEDYSNEIKKTTQKMDVETLKKEFIKVKTLYDTEGIQKSLVNIKKHRLKSSQKKK